MCFLPWLYLSEWAFRSLKMMKHKSITWEIKEHLMPLPSMAEGWTDAYVEIHTYLDSNKYNSIQVRPWVFQPRPKVPKKKPLLVLAMM